MEKSVLSYGKRTRLQPLEKLGVSLEAKWHGKLARRADPKVLANQKPKLPTSVVYRKSEFLHYRGYLSLVFMTNYVH